jgi:phasin protein
MSKRKSTKGPKRAHKPKIPARAQRNKQSIVRSSKNGLQRSDSRVSAESPREIRDDPKREARFAQTAAALQNGVGVTDSRATVNVQAYQAKLLEMAQANMEFAFELGPRLAKVRSPLEFFALIADFTSRQIGMFQKYSKEMAAYSFWHLPQHPTLR